MKNYTDCQEEYDVSVLLMPTCINGLKKLAESFNSTEEEYLLALGDLADCFFHYVNTDEAPKLKTQLSQIAFEFAKEQARQSANRYKTGKTNGKKGVEAKKLKADAKRVKESAKAKQAEQLNTVKPEQALDQINAKNTEKNDKNLDNKGVSTGPDKAQQPKKPQQFPKEKQLDWNCVEGLELTEQQQKEAIRIRKANNPGSTASAKKLQKFTQASLKIFLGQVKQSVDAGISIDELLDVWEGKQWRSWTHSYYADQIANDLKAQSQTAKNLKSVQWAQESAKDNDWDNLEITPLVKDLVQSSIDEKIKQSKKGGN